MELLIWGAEAKNNDNKCSFGLIMMDILNFEMKLLKTLFYSTFI